ncbi:uncharacterized protein LOC133791745 [Humulus lupulus]|uniref:uncharacterized protein LOC133791745 n=1 Tax=Humulus lupulus TaxID=3486 RepID=UPI002B413570|nr:uncharacterized protein LOC133791745 [Humulus lupulus]
MIHQLAQGGVASNNGQNAVIVADDRDRAIRQYALPLFNELNPGIVRPKIQAAQFELKPVMFQMLQTVGQFSGMPTEDPHLHLRLFIEVSDSFKLPGVTKDALRLKLFPYSLRDRARAWLNSLPSDSVSTWQELAEWFLMKYFPPTKNAKLRNEITSFQQLDEESLYEAWERFKELLRKCPHHGIPHCIQMETFYNSLNTHTRMVVDASANGVLLAKSYNELPTSRLSTGRKVAGIHDVDAITSLAAQVSSISNMLKTMNMGMNQSMGQPMGTQMGKMESISCVYYGEGHTFDNCPSNPAAVCYMGNQNRNGPYSNSYNPSWRPHPNFSWSNQGAGPSNPSMPPRPNFPPGYPPQAPQQRPQQQTMQSSSLENMLKEYIVKNEAMIQSQAASLRNLENQVGQLANELRNRPHGTLPSDIENPRSMGKEHCKVVTLRSGKELEKDKIKSGHEGEPSSIQINEEFQKDAELPSAQKSASAQNAAGMPQHCQPASSISKKSPPFPQRFQKQKLDSQFKKFLDMLKQLHINIPLVEALEQIPNYVKFMKDILTRKRRLGEFETVALTKECSSFLQNKLPPKMKDLGSFTIPCTIDRSLAYPDGKIEDVLVKVDKFIFPVDFIVLDYEADREVPIILGRPFLATGRTLIDVQKGELTMRVQDEQATFNVFKDMRFPDEVEECSVVSVVDYLASKELENNFDDPLEKLIMFDSHAEDEDEYLPWLEASSQGLHTRKHFESLELPSRSFAAPKPSMEKPLELELKALPSHLRYAYLGKSSTLPVIVSAELSME